MVRLTRTVGPLAVLVLSPLGPGVAAGQEDAGWSDRVPNVGGARHHYVGPRGKPDNPGTPTLALGLAGKEGAPVHVRAVPGCGPRSSTPRSPVPPPHRGSRGRSPSRHRGTSACSSASARGASSSTW